LAIFLLAPIALIYRAFLLPKVQDDAYKSLEQINQELLTANRSIQQLNNELFLTLAKIFDARDPYVGGHAAQVATYAVAIAEALALPPERIEIIRQSAYLHDIGKIAIPESILHKPDKLTDAEYEFIKRHANIGADFIETSHGLRHLAPFVRYHHERWDGRGYPQGLAGDAIPLEARILALCDSVEAMASDRPYHKALSIDEIIREVRHCSGAQFDPQIAETFVQLIQLQQDRLVVNSARTITLQYAGAHTPGDEGQQQFPNFAEIYGMVIA
jgi:putative nucleotidyltransferase with HDIG domain